MSVHLATAQPKVVTYVPNWIDLRSFAETIAYAKLTHIKVAFENPQDATGRLSFNAQNPALIAKARMHGVKILVSIGGGAASSNETMRNRYFDLLTDANRARFVARLADYVVTNQFDGLDRRVSAV